MNAEECNVIRKKLYNMYDDAMVCSHIIIKYYYAYLLHYLL